MKLIDLLVKELPRLGGWPEGVTHIGQDYDRELRFYGRGETRTGIILDELAVDRRKIGASDKGVTKSQYEAALAASEGWIDWHGGEFPVDIDAIVEVKCRWHNPRQYNNDRAGDFYWAHTGSNSDIIAYRLHDQSINHRARDDRLEQDLNECIGQDMYPVWNGDGLPPVGCECEYVHGLLAAAKNDSKPKSNTIVRVVAHQYYNHRDVCVCVWINAEGGMRSSVFSPRCLKPVRTEAEKLRDEAGLALYHAINWNEEGEMVSPSRMEDYKKAYDAIAAGKIPGVKLEGK